MSQSQPPGSPGILSGTSEPGARTAPATATAAAVTESGPSLAAWSSSAPGSVEPAPPPRGAPLMVVAPLFGPVGRRRSPLAVVALSVVSLGLYGLVWHGRINREMADFDPWLPIRAGRSSWAIRLPWGLLWLVALAAAARTVLAHAGVTADLPVSEHWTRWAVLAPVAIAPLLLLLPFSLVAVVMTLERIRVVEDRVDILGDDQLRPAAACWWLGLPLAGGPLLMALQQRRLNRVWNRVAPS